MPWTGKQFASRHNKKLSGVVAGKAAAQANAILRSGAPEGVAIATANKRADKMMRPGSSPKSAAEAMADRKRQGLTYREVAGEHGVSKSTAHRKARGLLRSGFTREGSAF